MGIFNFKSQKKQEPEQPFQMIVRAPELRDFFSASSIRPKVDESRNGLVTFNTAGTSDNAYPYRLLEYYESCPLHAAIVTAKAKLSAGDGITFNGQDYNEHLGDQTSKYLLTFVDKVNREQDIYSLLAQVSLDLQVYGAMAFEIVWSLDYSRIQEIVRVNPADVRFNQDHTEFTIKDWRAGTRDEVVLPAFDQAKAKQQKQSSQILYIPKAANIKHYGLPEYVSGLEHIAMEKAIAEFHAASLENQFAPSLIITFPRMPKNQEEADEFKRSMNDSFGGPKKAGKPWFLFGENGVLPTVTVVEAAKLDERLLELKDSVTESIIYAHRVSSPALLGISVPGKLGMTQELPTAFAIFNHTVVGPDRKLLERTFTTLANLFGVPYNFEIKQFNPLQQ